jgi:hypothetical protein
MSHSSVSTCPDEFSGLAGQVKQYRAGLEYADRFLAVERRVIDDGGHAIVRCDLQKIRFELLARADVHALQCVGELRLFEK